MSMVDSKSLSYKLLAGSVECFSEGRCYPIFDDIIVDFFVECSRHIRSNSFCKQFPDLITFAFFCRKASLNKASQFYCSAGKRVGWGRSVHIAPSNVPINMAYTLFFGMISGNKCLIRAPSKDFPQLSLLYEIMKSISSKTHFKTIKDRFCIIQCPHESDFLIWSLGVAESRVVWGGDSTVQAIRSHTARASAVELAFPDRTSICMLDALHINRLSDLDLDILSDKFFNDSLLVDQNACSSPSQVFWINSDGLDHAVDRFWRSVGDAELRNGPLGAKKYIDKLTDIGKRVQDFSAVKFREYGLGTTVEVARDTCSKDKRRLGLYIEHHLEELNQFLSFTSKKTQTLTYSGIDANLLRQLVINSGELGIDRVVPIGQALDIGFVWDGKDILRSLSRQITVI